MKTQLNFSWKLRLVIPLLLVVSLLVWGVRRAYCHFHERMSEPASSGAAASEQRLPFVTVVEPVRRPVVRPVTLAASVEAFEKATLYAKVAGYLRWIKVDKGDPVKRDEVLALIEVPEMEKDYQSAQAAVKEAQAAYERAQAEAALKDLTYKRLAGVRQSRPNVIPQQEVDVARAASEVAQSDTKLAAAKLELARSELEKLKALMEYAEIKSPYDGDVIERFVDAGALIQKGTNSTGNVALLVTVANMDRVRIYVNVPEPDVPYLKRGVPAEVLLDAFPGRVLQGRITRFATALDPPTRTMKTEIDLPNPGHFIRPGMFGTVKLKLGAEAAGLFLPAQSIRQDPEGKRFVYAVEQGLLRKIPIETGLDDGRWIEVKGLRGSETVVLASPEDLHEGLAVKAVKPPPNSIPQLE